MDNILKKLLKSAKRVDVWWKYHTKEIIIEAWSEKEIKRDIPTLDGEHFKNHHMR